MIKNALLVLTAALAMGGAPALASDDKPFRCKAPAMGWNNGCQTRTVPAGACVWVYNRTSQNTDITYRIQGSQLRLKERQSGRLWRNASNHPVDATMGVYAHDLDDTVWAEGKTYISGC
ncbi:hypothetical protein [Nonomuraea endophytica]|uniref:Uncharacterized protein n=1 Tax=Nonomuraea endophytica TaxID=714136 RepID=A0A7W8EMP5_9ACTN|nr:hypothetical protein [Nonomuraea endophytica]MBB5085239.1 hypothetical protein [Nonomuraea endophytica]